MDASSTYFANTAVNVSTFRQASNNVPFFSDFSIAVLNFNDLKNTWNNDSKVLDEFINTPSDENKINDTAVTLNSTAGFGPISQNLAPGNYFIWVTRGVDPKEIISWNLIKVMPFSSSIIIGDGTDTAIQGQNLNVNITINSSAPAENYTYVSSIINRSDFSDNLGDINITWSSGQTLAQATRVNGTVINNSNGLTDIIPRSNTTRFTNNLFSANLTLKTGTLPAGSYLVNTVVFNNTNLSVAFNQSSITLITLTSITVSPSIFQRLWAATEPRF